MPITSFRTGAFAGFVAGTIATLTGVPADALVATITMRVWDNQGGTLTTWPDAVTANGPWGEAPLFNLNAIGGPRLGDIAPALVGLQSFNITTIPEPSTFALAGLVTALLVVLRRTSS